MKMSIANKCIIYILKIQYIGKIHSYIFFFFRLKTQLYIYLFLFENKIDEQSKQKHQ